MEQPRDVVNITHARASESFAPEPVSTRDARGFLRAFLEQNGGRDQLADAAELALSEVVTNAVLHAHTAFDVVLLLSPDGSLRVEVTDRSPQLPMQRDYAEQATTGRGMDLVAAYTHDCGVDGHGSEGKTVWFVLLPDGRDPEEQTEQDLLDSWDIDTDDAADAAGGDEHVILLGLPPTLWLAAREHHDAILRELALLAVEHPDKAPEPARIAEADRARARISTRVIAELDRRSTPAHRVPPEGHPRPLSDTLATLDLEVRVPAGAAAAFGALQDVLDVGESLARRGLLLARPGLPEIVALRDWTCEQVISQGRGVLPTRWPGVGQERFTDEIRDRDEPDPLAWDMRIVSESDRGAIAADDANRIIAVSRPIADALGWAVDDLVGRRVVAVIPPELREAHVSAFTRHITTGESRAIGVPLTLPVLRADGTCLDCRLLLEQTPSRAGRAVYIAWIDVLTTPPAPAPGGSRGSTR